MIVVRVELHSAITRQVTEIARMHICNIGGTRQLGNYRVETFRGRSAAELNRYVVQRDGTVRNHPRLSVHVWHLVGKALASIGYVKPQPHEAPDQPSDILPAILEITEPFSRADVERLRQAWASQHGKDQVDG